MSSKGRDYLLQVRLSELEHVALLAMCHELDLNMSQVIRLLTAREFERLGLMHQEKEVEGVA